MLNLTKPGKQNIQEFCISEALGGLNEVERKHAPKKAYYLGDLSILSKNGGRVSIVGSRKPSKNGERRAKAVTEILLKHGVTIMSGMAEGIDTIAHKTAIANNGSTVAVLGTPLDAPYPKSNVHLFDELSKNQLVISQFSPGYPLQSKNFPIRNRTMALLSHATIIIEASEKSGTIHQGWEALRLGRPLYLLESLVQDNSLSWPAEFLKYGACVLTRDNVDDVIFELPTEVLDKGSYDDFFA